MDLIQTLQNVGFEVIYVSTSDHDITKISLSGGSYVQHFHSENLIHVVIQRQHEAPMARKAVRRLINRGSYLARVINL